MADTGRTVWADGFWSQDFWAVGLWAADEPVIVPDVDDPGTTQAAAIALIEGAGLVAAVVNAYSSTIPAGEVISQSPAAGASVTAGSTVTITVSLGVQTRVDAGRKTLRRTKNYYVEIDGQSFPVESVQHAQALLERAAELASQAAEVKAQAIVAKAPAKPVQVVIAVPEIKTNAPMKVRPYVDRIADAYKAAAIEAELQMRMRYELLLDDEEAAMLLLS